MCIIFLACTRGWADGSVHNILKMSEGTASKGVTETEDYDDDNVEKDERAP